MPIAAKFCTVIGSVFDFIIRVQNFGGGLSPKNVGAKNMQNLDRFRTFSKFYDEYLQKGYRYLKSDKYLIDCYSSRVRRKSLVNFGPVTTEI